MDQPESGRRAFEARAAVPRGGLETLKGEHGEGTQLPLIMPNATLDIR
jgi:hypothetical protein